jgi:hypothetical protein
VAGFNHRNAVTGYNTQLSFDVANNRANSSGFSFDGSGSLTANNTGVSLAYNPENFMTGAGTTSY